MFIGQFYFKHTGNGNLIGEYSCNADLHIGTESADRIGDGEGFVGSYNATWQENGEPMFANLEIRHRSSTNDRLFKLEWRRGGRLIYKGEGMISDDVLLGHYTKGNIRT